MRFDSRFQTLPGQTPVTFSSGTAGNFNPKIRKLVRLNSLGFSLLTALALTFALAPAARAEQPPSFGLTDAREQGVEKSEFASGTVVTSYDEVEKKDILDCTYSLAKGSSVRVWLKGFPSGLTASAVNTAKASLLVPHGDQVKEISAVLELSGSKGTQKIPLPFKRGRNAFAQPLNWELIGDLSEAAFIISAAGTEEEVKGALNLSLEFFRQTQAAESDAPVSPSAARTSYSVLEAREKDIFSSGSAKGSMLPTFDDVVGKDVFEFDYTVSRGGVIGISAKDFPEELGPKRVNLAKIGIRTLDPGQDRDLNVTVELKGSSSVQTIPLRLKAGWNSKLEAIDWNSLGSLSEVSFIVTPSEETESAKGTLYLSLDFLNQIPLPPVKSPEGPAPFSLLDASEKGVFNIGPGGGQAYVTFNETLGRDVFGFDYNIPLGSVVGIWTQTYPAELHKKAADAVSINVYVPNSKQLQEVAVKVEIKSEKTWQTIPLHLQVGWNSFQELVNWNMIGDLSEVVFVVSPTVAGLTGGSPVEVSRPSPEEPSSLTGTLLFDLQFSKVTALQKYFLLLKIVLLIGISFAAAFLSLLSGKNLAASSAEVRPNAANGSPWITRIKQDFFYGLLAILIGATAIWIYSLGTRSPLEVGFNFSFLAVGILGALIAHLMKTSLTGKGLTPGEVFQNTLLMGLLAAASTRQGLWEPPATWVELLTISHLTATVVFLLYFIFNLFAMTSSGKHLKALPAAAIVTTPFFFGWLLLLQNINLLKDLGNAVTFGMLSSWPMLLDLIGRTLVVFGFNEFVANGISLLTRGRFVKPAKPHGFILLVSLGVVVAPLIADLGSMPLLMTLPALLRIAIATLTVMLSYAGLWGEVYLLTGILLDAGKRTPPTMETITGHVTAGMKKGAIFSGILLGLLYLLSIVLGTPVLQQMMSSFPIVCGIVACALLFPLLKTIIETFDGSIAFFVRVKQSYQNPVLYARGAIVGYGFASMIVRGMFQHGMADRIAFGCLVGLAASAGVSILRDAVYGLKGRGKIQSWRLYLTDAFLGMFVGMAAAFYLDARQVPVIIEKFRLYVSTGFDAVKYMTYPLVNKWGRIDLGTYTGGVKLLFTESLAGVINWAIAAWLFAINKVLLQSLLDKHTGPIKFFFSRAGFAQLIEHMIYVLRWGLWMSPIIFTFLRMMPDPTWYNQDGLIRTFFAIFNNATMTPEAFHSWSLTLFVYVLAFDFFRVLIWMDHMGLRVATLVNLSFIGLDKLDEKVSRWIGPAASQRYFPEAVKRFCTWAPLLIPFYLPRGKDWDYAWSTSEAIQSASRESVLSAFRNLSTAEMFALAGAVILAATAVSFVIRQLIARGRRAQVKSFCLANREYRVFVKENGEVYSEADHHKSTVYPPEYDITRRSFDLIDPSGRILYVLDTAKPVKDGGRYWPVTGNFPRDSFEPSRIIREDHALKIVNTANGIQTTITITLPEEYTPAELWEIRVENLGDAGRQLKVVPYLEWVLNGGIHDRFHTQYQRLFPEMEYVRELNSMLAWNRSTKAMGVLAVDLPPEGFLNARIDFIGRAQSIWKPRALETLEFLEAKDTAPYPTFDPISSLLIDMTLKPKDSKTLKLMIAYTKNRDSALKLIRQYMSPQAAKGAGSIKPKKKPMLIGHGDILPGTPQPYSEYADQGRKLIVHTPYTPRPYDHALSNGVGHCIMVTNRGLHTSSSGNSQQNRLTPDIPDLITQETPAEAIYLYDPEQKEWFSPTYHPLNDPEGKYLSEFSVDGTALFRTSKGTLSSELTVFAPSDDPLGVYLLTVKNTGKKTRRLRIASYFEMVLDFQPERSGTLQVRHDKALNALFFENPRNMFRDGWAFASTTLAVEHVETRRGRFFGSNRGIKHPYLVEKGKPDASEFADAKQIAGFLGTLEIPANGEKTVAIILGQTETRKHAVELVQKYKNMTAVKESLSATRKWWLSLMETMTVETNHPEFDRYHYWLKYQALAERIWARRGFYQTSGAYGFRDQLQDTVNLVWVDPVLARQQIILCARQQYPEGDVYHWFFTRMDGRSAFACRSHASDNPLWLAWAVGEYVRTTGDESILDELAPYASAQFPFEDLPKNKPGWGHLYHQSTLSDTIYRHCICSLDLVMEKRMGVNGLPLIRTGDWNDGLDEIGSEGKGESVWLGFFLYNILKDMLPIIGKKEGAARKEHYEKKMTALAAALEKTWREDRYLRAFHDDGTEIGLKNSGVWEIDALTAAWAVMAGINPERELLMYNTALEILEKDNVILLGWPALREDTKPYLGRSSKYPEGVRENGMYCHGTQWLIRAARVLAERFEKQGNEKKAAEYLETAYRLWKKITPLDHVTPKEIEIYGGQPNKQPADLLTNFEPGRMIWHGYTGAAGWLLREAYDSVVGASLIGNQLVLPEDIDKPRDGLKVKRVHRDLTKSPLKPHGNFKGQSQPAGEVGSSSPAKVPAGAV